MNNLRKCKKLGYKITDNSYGSITLCKSKNGSHKMITLDSSDYSVLSNVHESSVK